MRSSFLTLILGSIILFIGTGIYALLPSIAYIGVLVAIIFVIGNQNFIRSPLAYIEPNMIIGFLLLNSFFIFHSLFYSFDARIYFLHVISLGMLLLVYAIGKLIYLDKEKGKILRNEAHITFFVLISLILLLLAQIAQLLGYIDLPDDVTGGQEFTLTLRPGGFLNPNTTASIAIVCLFIVEKLNKVNRKYLTFLALCLTSTIVLLSQSRAAILVLVIFAVLLILRKRTNFFSVLGVSLLILIAIGVGMYQEGVKNLIDTAAFRFSGDASSSNRLSLLQTGFTVFSDAPIFGNGYRYLAMNVGYSAHNEVVENLVNFGVFGVVVVGMAFGLIYFPFSPYLFLVCVLPMFLFSHNFFETTSYQAMLGLALIVDRATKDSLEKPKEIPAGRGL